MLPDPICQLPYIHRLKSKPVLAKVVLVASIPQGGTRCQEATSIRSRAKTLPLHIGGGTFPAAAVLAREPGGNGRQLPERIKQGEQAENEMLCPWLQRRPPSSTSSRRATSRTDTVPGDTPAKRLPETHRTLRNSIRPGGSSPGTPRDVLRRSLRHCATLSHLAGPVILRRVRCPA